MFKKQISSYQTLPSQHRNPMYSTTIGTTSVTSMKSIASRNSKMNVQNLISEKNLYDVSVAKNKEDDVRSKHSNDSRKSYNSSKGSTSGMKQKLEDIKRQKLIKQQLMVKLESPLVNDSAINKMVPFDVFKKEAENVGMIINNEDLQTISRQYENHKGMINYDWILKNLIPVLSREDNSIRWTFKKEKGSKLLGKGMTASVLSNHSEYGNFSSNKI